VIDTAIDGGDPVLSNVRMTFAHMELSRALRAITGEDSGANFHTWAVWGSKKAGRTIRQEDVPWLPRSLIRGALARAARQIFAGNVTVLDDIGRETARFVCAFSNPSERTETNLERWLQPLRRGPAEIGGQDLLREAYRHYFLAAASPPSDRRDELMLTANLLAILHEHHRLDPYIDAAMPRVVRSVVTRHLLTFSIGTDAMRVSRDVTRRGRSQFPATLQTIELPELDALLHGRGGLDRTPNSVRGSAARDWSELGDRMNFIVDLFRTRQFDDNLFAAPFSASERASLVHDYPTLASVLAT